MALYTVLTDFWHKNVIVPAKSVIEMTQSEVKYLSHVVEEVKARVGDTVEEVVEAASEISDAVKGNGPRSKSNTEDK